jgi:hypothetical protein
VSETTIASFQKEWQRDSKIIRLAKRAERDRIRAGLLAGLDNERGDLPTYYVDQEVVAVADVRNLIDRICPPED